MIKRHRFHDGIDIAAVYGAKIRASADGLFKILPTGKLLGDVEIKNISIGDRALFYVRFSTISFKEKDMPADTSEELRFNSLLA